MNKKFISIMLVMLLISGIVVGCKKDKPNEDYNLSQKVENREENKEKENIDITKEEEIQTDLVDKGNLPEIKTIDPNTLTTKGVTEEEKQSLNPSGQTIVEMNGVKFKYQPSLYGFMNDFAYKNAPIIVDKLIGEEEPTEEMYKLFAILKDSDMLPYEGPNTSALGTDSHSSVSDYFTRTNISILDIEQRDKTLAKMLYRKVNAPDKTSFEYQNAWNGAVKTVDSMHPELKGEDREAEIWATFVKYIGSSITDPYMALVDAMEMRIHLELTRRFQPSKYAYFVQTNGDPFMWFEASYPEGATILSRDKDVQKWIDEALRKLLV